MEKNDKRATFLKRTRESVKVAIKSRDMLLASVIRTTVDIDKVSNLLSERLEEWYGIYFPEVIFDEKEKYPEFIIMFDKKNIDKKELAQLVGQKRTDEIVAKAERSLGTDLSDEDLSEIKAFAVRLLDLYKARERYTTYLGKLGQEICPNMVAVAGTEVAAKLISHVGSLHRLAVLPASTIQVLGAETALFKHLKNKRIDPPKHGIIFQNVKISSSPKSVRGKIARLLANKLSLAAKADAFTKTNMTEKLKADVEARYKEIMQQYEKGKSKNKSKNEDEQ
ncbi:MAG: hypothetical protein Q7S22_06290 [Candidatus Micrarchaeota archaeon]|nr:hypothetical protein [Candidatus Micrarchaeota archaeon]